jgi:hypothetical protein
MRHETDPWAEQDRRDSLGPVLIGQALHASKQSLKYAPNSQPQDMADRINCITGLAGRWPGANASNVAAERERIKFLVQDTMTLTMPILRATLRDGVTKWKFMPSAAEIFELAAPHIAEARDLARIDALHHQGLDAARRFKALPAPKPRETTPADLAALNEWGAPLGIAWDANGKMTQTDRSIAGPAKLEQRERHTASPKAADYAEIRERIAGAMPPVSDASSALKAMIAGKQA